jgi:hypothetical protein
MLSLTPKLGKSAEGGGSNVLEGKGFIIGAALRTKE